MHKSDVFLKTDLGRDEIQSQGLGVLPREARTLLIMIDGKRDYQSYLDTLDHRKMFASFGGITPLIELLLELQYIETISATDASMMAQAQPIVQAAEINIKSTIGRTFKNRPPRRMRAISNVFKTKLSAARYETIKSELAVYIEKNASAAEAWRYLLLLEQCVDSSQLLILAQEIQNNNKSDLSRGMSSFIERIERNRSIVL